MLFGGFTADSTYVGKCSDATSGKALPGWGFTEEREESGKKEKEGFFWRQEAAIKPAPRRRVGRDVFKTYSSIRTDTPTPLTSTYRGSSLAPQFLFRSSPFLPRLPRVVFAFLSGERPVKSTVYYVFRPHPDKNTRHARTTHSALFLYLFYRLPTSFLLFAPRFFRSHLSQPDKSLDSPRLEPLASRDFVS